MLRLARAVMVLLALCCSLYSRALRSLPRHSTARRASLSIGAAGADFKEGGGSAASKRRTSSRSSDGGAAKVDYRNRNNRSGSNTGRGTYKGQKDKDDESSEPVSKEVLDALVGPTVVLERGKARLFQDGNPLVYGGAVKMVVNGPAAGDEVRVVDHFGNLLGRGFFNPLSQYRVRMMVRAEEDKEIGLEMGALIQRRVLQAAAVRRSVGLPSESSNVYRLVNGEGDRLGGLIIDVIGSTVVVQSSALWVEAQKVTVEKVVRAVMGKQCPKLVWKRVESRLRQDGYEGAFGDETSGGAAAGSEEVVVESGAKFVVSAEDGQKTGFYCDQRDNRQMLRRLSAGKTVLDAYCYTGGFSVHMALGGATKVTAVDSSQLALDTLAKNAALNGVQGVVEGHKADALAFMQRLADEGQQFDIVVLDPPKLAPSRADLDRARGKYAKINTLGLRLVRPGGLLLTCTCSAACTQSGEFVSIVASAARQARRDVTVLVQAGAAPDHPVHSGYAEGRYLTALLAAVA